MGLGHLIYVEIKHLAMLSFHFFFKFCCGLGFFEEPHQLTDIAKGRIFAQQLFFHYKESSRIHYRQKKHPSL